MAESKTEQVNQVMAEMDAALHAVLNACEQRRGIVFPAEITVIDHLVLVLGAVEEQAATNDAKAQSVFRDLKRAEERIVELKHQLTKADGELAAAKNMICQLERDLGYSDCHPTLADRIDKVAKMLAKRQRYIGDEKAEN